VFFDSRTNFRNPRVTTFRGARVLASLAGAAALAIPGGCGVRHTDTSKNEEPPRAAPGGNDRDVTDPIQRATVEVMERARPAIVLIEAVIKNYAAGREIKTTSTGTGFHF